MTFFAAAKISSSFPAPDLPEIAFAGAYFLYIILHVMHGSESNDFYFLVLILFVPLCCIPYYRKTFLYHEDIIHLLTQNFFVHWCNSTMALVRVEFCSIIGLRAENQRTVLLEEECTMFNWTIFLFSQTVYGGLFFGDPKYLFERPFLW